MKKIMSGCLVCLLLVACQASPFAVHPTVREKERAEQAKLAQQVRHLIILQLQKREYSFQMMAPPSKRCFRGSQVGEDWTIKECPSRKLVMQRKEKRVHVYHDSKTEVLTLRQAGLVSPRDHLSFVLEMAKSYRIGPSIQVNHQPADVIEVDIDEKRLLDKIKQTLFLEDTVAMPDKIKVGYKLAIAKPNKLVQLTLLIQSQDRDHVQQLTYDLL